MSNPAAYPANDSDEHQAIALLECIIDPQYIKTQIQKRDKFPNVDGFVEIVEMRGGKSVPIGKIDVQIKKIPANAESFSCPTELVAYSETVTTLPVLLICSDPHTRRVFWKHVHQGMPEFKKDQKTFTIKFDAAVDAIDNTNLYIRRWTEIVLEYQSRIANFPALHNEITNKFGLSNLSAADIQYFQKFIEQTNTLLDREFSIVKQLYLGDAWKLGVAVLKPHGVGIAFQTYRIPYGTNSPLIISLADHGLRDVFEQSKSTATTRLPFIPHGCQPLRSQISSHRKEPDILAQEGVLDLLARAVNNRHLRLGGELLCVEALFCFLDEYAHTLGLALSDEYKLVDLNYGVHVYLPAWHQIAMSEFLKDHHKLLKTIGYLPAFENVAAQWPQNRHPSDDEVRRLIAENRASFEFPILSRQLSFASIYEALNYLTSHGIDSIRRPYPKRTTVGGWIWSGYSEDSFRDLTSKVLLNAVDAYREFLAVNSIHLSKSIYLDPKYSLIYFIRFSDWITNNIGPSVIRYCVENPSNMLRKVQIVEEDHVFRDAEIQIDGVKYDIIAGAWTGADPLFEKQPLLACVYGMLAQDIDREYGINPFGHHITTII